MVNGPTFYPIRRVPVWVAAGVLLAITITGTLIALIIFGGM
jgi:hypothetical protein